MAKRKKSKKYTQSEKVAEAPAPESNENAAPSEAVAESQTDHPHIAETPSHDVVEETPAREGQSDLGDTATANDTDGAQIVTEATPEGSAELQADAPQPEEGCAEPAEPIETAPANRGTDEAQVAPTEEAVAEETPSDAAADATDVAAATGGAETGELAAGEAGQDEEILAGSKLESILESMLFASDKPLGLTELKRLLGERDGKKITAALTALTERRKGSGIEVAALSSGWHLRTNPENATWVSKLLVGRPVRLSRAMLETLAIVAYRQPVTRPEVDDIRGVDCGPVLKTLLDRGLVRIIGKKEEVGRPMLYGTTPEFLRIFNLRDLSELPTLREFYDLSTEDQSRVEAEHGPEPENQTPSAITPKPDVALNSVMRGALQPEPEDTDPLLDELDEASQLAKQALGELEPAAEGDDAPAEAAKPESDVKTGEEPPAPPPSAGE
jgi:segregation and condensation protein B